MTKCSYCADKRYFSDLPKIQTIDGKVICAGCFVSEGQQAYQEYISEIKMLSKLNSEMRNW
jgi:hypothetical protein